MIKQGQKEEITDIMSDKVYTQKVGGQFVFHKGKVLKFARATIKITRIDRINKRMWGEHIALHEQDTVISHVGHDVDSTGDALEKHGKPWCNDCNGPITEKSTAAGDAKAKARRDDADLHILEDGTRVE